MSDTAKTLAALLLYGNELDAAQKKYATEVGEISIAWNKLHHVFFTAFIAVTGFPPEVAKSLWETSTKDSGQRALLLSVLDLLPNKTHREYFQDMCKHASAISSYRNSLIHALVDVDYETFSVKPKKWGNANKHIVNVNRVIDKNLFEALRSDLSELSMHMSINLMRILDNKNEPLLEIRPLAVYAFQTPPALSQNRPDSDEVPQSPPQS